MKAKGKRYIYLERVSKMGKRREGDAKTHTLDDQRRNASDAVAAVGGRIVKTKKMLDVSGFDVLAKVMDEIVDDIRSGRADAVVVGYDDRLSRNWMRLGIFLQAMLDIGETAGIEPPEVLDASAPDVDYRTDEGRTMWGLKGVVNELPSLKAKKRGKNLADSLVKTGIPNRVPYGYRRNRHEEVGENGETIVVQDDAERHPSSLMPDPETAPVVRRIFRMRLAGTPWFTIAETLNNEGIPSPRGGHWVNGTLSSIIANDAYIGVVKLGKRRNPEAHEALVDVNEWRRTQATKTVKRNGKLKAGNAKGLFACSGCGYRMTGHRGDNDRVFYGCAASKPCKRRVYVTLDRAEEFVDELMVDLLDNSDGFDIVSSARELEEAREAWETTKREKRQFSKNGAVMDEEDFAEGYAEHAEAERLAHEHYDDLLARAGDAEDLPTSGSAWRALDDEHKQRFLRRFITRIDVLPPVSRSKYAPIEDRFEVLFVNGDKLTSAGWELAA